MRAAVAGGDAAGLIGGYVSQLPRRSASPM